MKGRRVPVGTWIAEISAVAAARLTSSMLPLQPTSLRIAATSADSAFSRAQSMYDRGQIDLLPLLDAQRVRLAVRVNSNDSDTQLLLDSVQLYKALGGGWQAFEPVAASTSK
jgi:outer membrane protein TolC